VTIRSADWETGTVDRRSSDEDRESNGECLKLSEVGIVRHPTTGTTGHRPREMTVPFAPKPGLVSGISARDSSNLAQRPLGANQGPRNHDLEWILLVRAVQGQRNQRDKGLS
jgi:hypothetical protein